MSVVGVVISMLVALSTVFSILFIGFYLSRKKSSKFDYDHKKRFKSNSRSENIGQSYTSNNVVIEFEQAQPQFLLYHGNNNPANSTREFDRYSDSYSQNDKYRFSGSRTFSAQTNEIDESSSNREITLQFR